MRIGPAVYKGRWLVLIAWLGIAAGLCVIAPALDPDRPRTHQLPAGRQPLLPRRRCAPPRVPPFQRAQPGRRGLRTIRRQTHARRLPPRSKKSQPTSPNPPRRRRRRATSRASPSEAPVRSASPVCPCPPTRSRAPTDCAALILVDVPANFITIRSSRVVDHVRNLLADAHLPAGLHAAVTGSSGFGHDYAAATEASHQSIGLVTLISVLVILLLVYRSPVAAFVPLIAISVAAVVAMRVLAVGQHFGIHVGTGEKVFVFVLIYGAGMDYSMLFISRFREALHAGMAKGPGAARRWGNPRSHPRFRRYGYARPAHALRRTVPDLPHGWARHRHCAHRGAAGVGHARPGPRRTARQGVVLARPTLRPTRRNAILARRRPHRHTPTGVDHDCRCGSAGHPGRARRAPYVGLRHAGRDRTALAERCGKRGRGSERRQEALARRSDRPHNRPRAVEKTAAGCDLAAPGGAADLRRRLGRRCSGCPQPHPAARGTRGHDHAPRAPGGGRQNQRPVRIRRPHRHAPRSCSRQAFAHAFGHGRSRRHTPNRR